MLQLIKMQIHFKGEFLNKENFLAGDIPGPYFLRSSPGSFQIVLQLLVEEARLLFS